MADADMPDSTNMKDSKHEDVSTPLNEQNPASDDAKPTSPQPDEDDKDTEDWINYNRELTEQLSIVFSERTCPAHVRTEQRVQFIMYNILKWMQAKEEDLLENFLPAFDAEVLKLSTIIANEIVRVAKIAKKEGEDYKPLLPPLSHPSWLYWLPKDSKHESNQFIWDAYDQIREHPALYKP
jgi:hypothetical protein